MLRIEWRQGSDRLERSGHSSRTARSGGALAAGREGNRADGFTAIAGRTGAFKNCMVEEFNDD